jgi:hypothetical protein
MITIQQAIPEQAGILTTITVAAKRHWSYPENWIQAWLPLLTVTLEYIRENETWVVVEGEKYAAFYSLKQDDESLWLDNLWVFPEFMDRGLAESFLITPLKEAICMVKLC